MPCMRLAYTVGLTCLWEVCRTWHMRCQLLPLRVRDHSLVNRALTYSIFLCFSWPIYLAKEQELDISKWYLILQEVRDSHRPHARMGPSPKAFFIWIFEKKAQRNELFFFYSPKKKKRKWWAQAEGQDYISKRYIWTQRSWRFSTGMGPQARNLFESLKYHQFFLWLWWVCLDFFFNHFFSNISLIFYIKYYKFKSTFSCML